MLLIRELLYQEKTLDDFDIDSDGSIFKYFFEVLLEIPGTRITERNVEKNIADMFNDACYICTLSFICKRPLLNVGMFRDLCNQKQIEGLNYYTNGKRADVVLCMVYYLLKNCRERNDKTNKMILGLDKHLRGRTSESNETYKDFFNKLDTYNQLLPTGYFKRITITPNLLEELKLNWFMLTNDYDREKLTNLVTFWKDAPQRNAIIDDIIKNVEINRVLDDLPF
ncbi:MAG: hypothetical protein IKK81_11410 [Prevotella sp.]|nr:hypothetical protein [Prevotella sp.]